MECGCASGYTTKYMRDELGCNVWIVEYDRDAYDQAINYAVDGVCGDLMAKEWTNAFRGMQFDYIMFVDVLEHLYAPEFVLVRSTALLADDGAVLVSLPNVTNNDVIAKMLAGSFDYTPTGLLDETHIRFFGPNNIESFFTQASLSITMFDYTTSDFFGSEQRAASEVVDERTNEILQAHAWGSVYQFVIVAKKTASISPNSIVPVKLPPNQAVTMPANLFYAGSEECFSSERVIRLSLRSASVLEESIDIASMGITQIRLDPVEGIPCLISNLSVKADGTELSPSSCNGSKIDSHYIFVTKDPQIAYDVPQNAKTLEIFATVSLALGKEGMAHIRLLDHAARQLGTETNRRIIAEQRLAERKDELAGLHAITGMLTESRQEAEAAQKEVDKLREVVKENKRNNRSVSWTAKRLCRLCIAKVKPKRHKAN